MYATYALTSDRMTIHQLARHMDKSVGMIEKHYSHILLIKMLHSLVGIVGCCWEVRVNKVFDIWKQGFSQKIWNLIKRMFIPLT